MHTGNDRHEILAAARAQIDHGRYAASPIYYRDGASQAIVDVLVGAELYTQKRFCDNADARAGLA